MQTLNRIEGFKRYAVTPDGRVWSDPKHGHDGTWLKTFLTGSGYKALSLCKDGKTYKKYIHRLVALTYISNPENKPEVNHKDCDKLNNNVSNLEWMTDSENKQHSMDNNRWDREAHSRKMSGAGNPNYGKRPSQKTIDAMLKRCSIKVRCIETGIIYNSMNEAGKTLGFHDGGNISKQIKGRAKTAYGYHWEYYSDSN